MIVLYSTKKVPSYIRKLAPHEPYRGTACICKAANPRLITMFPQFVSTVSFDRRKPPPPQALAAASPAGGSYRRRSMSGAFDDSPGGPVGSSPGTVGFASPVRRQSSARARADSGTTAAANGTGSSSGVGFGSLAKRNAEGSPDAPGVVGLTNLGNTCYMNSVSACIELQKEDLNERHV